MISIHSLFVGCPFRHSDPELLKQKLQSYKVSPSGINQVGVILATDTSQRTRPSFRRHHCLLIPPFHLIKYFISTLGS